MLTVTKQVEVQVPMFAPSRSKAVTGKKPDLPLVGDTQLLDKAEHCLVTNWDGDAQQVFVNVKPSRLDESWFEPNDKGSLSVFGLNNAGQVIFGMARYDGDPRSENEIENGAHYYIKATSKVSRFS